MEGHSTPVPVHVTVLMATVGVRVEVSCKRTVTMVTAHYLDYVIATMEVHHEFVAVRITVYA